MIFANVIQDAFAPLITLFEGIMVFIHDHLVGGSWGLAIVGLTVLIRAILVPLTYRQLKSMQEMQRLAPADAGDQRALQGRQTAPAAGADEVLPGEQNQPAGLLPAAAAAAARVHLAVLHAAHGPEEAHLPGRADHAPTTTRRTRWSSTSAKCRRSSSEKRPATRSQPHSAKFLFIPDITDKATGIVLIVLIVLYVASQLGSTLIATASADPNQRRLMLLLPVVFVVILYPLPGGAARVLDHHERVDDRPAVDHPPPIAPAATAPGQEGSTNGKPRSSLKQMFAGAATTPAAEVAGASGSAGSAADAGASGGDPERAPTATATQEEETIREA